MALPLRACLLALEVSGDEPVALSSAKRFRQHLVGDAVQSVVKASIATSSFGQLGNDFESPTTTEQVDDQPRASVRLVRSRPLLEEISPIVCREPLGPCNVRVNRLNNLAARTEGEDLANPVAVGCNSLVSARLLL